MGVVDYLNTEIYRRFNEEGIDIPFPQRTVWMKKDEG
jgi:small-conductance mechanosensitive channel